MADENTVKRDRWKVDGNRWEMVGTPDGWPRPIPGIHIAQARLQLCPVCSEWHIAGRTPDGCLQKLAARIEAGLELFPGWDAPRAKGGDDGDAG